MTQRVEIYLDDFSPPCRAIEIFCKMSLIPYEKMERSLVALDHKSKEYKQINPILTLPGLRDQEIDLSMGESHSIMKYLSQKYQKYDLYPQDIKTKALVNFYCDWHLGNFRAFMYPYLRGKYILPLFQQEPSVKLELVLKNDIKKCFKNFENGFLGRNSNDFIVGNKVTLADISAYCEIYQFVCTEAYDLTPYPRTQKWIKKMQQFKEVQEFDEKMRISVNQTFGMEMAKL